MSTGEIRSTAGDKARLQVDVLVEALPYIQRFRGATVVVKYGGNAMVDPSLARRFAEDVVLMRAVGMRPVVVHGGGPQIGDLMARLGKEPEFRDGLRVTDAETLDIARMVLVGKVNRDIVSSINVHGPLAVGLSGEDAGLIQASSRHPDLGFVGDVADVNPAIVERLLAESLIPVISTIGSDLHGQAYNINADTVAGAVAAALGAEKVVYLTDVEGLLAAEDDPASLIAETTVEELRPALDDDRLRGRADRRGRGPSGPAAKPPRADKDAKSERLSALALSGGMLPKILACLHAVEGGVNSAHILDGRVPHVLLLEIFTDAGIGTMITADATLRSRQAEQPRT